MPCDAQGNLLPPGAAPLPRPAPSNPWEPFEDEVQFETADFLYRRVEMSAGNIDHLLDLWADSLALSGGHGPFSSHEQMYAVIDATLRGDVPWRCFTVSYNGEVSAADPTWKTAEYEVWFRDPDEVIKFMLDNPDFDGQIDYAAYIALDKSGKRVWSDLMSANFAYRKSVSMLFPSLSFVN